MPLLDPLTRTDSNHIRSCHTCREAYDSGVIERWRGRPLTPPIDNFETNPQNEEVTEIEAEDDESMTLIAETPAIEESTFITNEGSCRCEACKIVKPRMGEYTKLKRARIHNYTYKPRAWKPQFVKNDPMKYYLGVELETDNYSSRGETDNYGRRIGAKYSVVDDGVAADMRLPKRLWIPKTDSSVTGPEFVSQPATMTYWTSKRKQLDMMFKMLLHAGYRSHDNDQAGMHINISLSAFDDSDHLYKFITLVHFSPVWARRMAQRTNESMNTWAKVDLGASQEIRRQLSKWAKQERVSRFLPPRVGQAYWQNNPNPNYVSRPSVNRYTALNIPGGFYTDGPEGRVEFRLPRGTLRVDRFFKNLQWTVAMVEYTRTAEVLESRPKAFMDWTVTKGREYPDLVAFLMERAPKLQAAVSR